MTLVTCRVCGSETSDQEEICMICGYPWQGRNRTRWWKIVAWGMAVMFLLFFLLSLF